MILRKIVMQECWCSHCGHGQMDVLHDIFFRERISDKEIIGREIKCSSCGKKNTVDDVLNIIPAAFMVSSNKEMSKVKVNEDLKRWYEAE